MTRERAHQDPDPEPFELGDALPFAIVRAGAALDRAFAARMRTIDLTPRHFGILSQFDADRRPTAAAIARTLGITPQAVGPQIAQLRDRGLITSTPRPGRGGPHELSLTPAGSAKLVQALALARAEQRRVLAGLDVDRRRAMLRELRRITDLTDEIHESAPGESGEGPDTTARPPTERGPLM